MDIISSLSSLSSSEEEEKSSGIFGQLIGPWNTLEEESSSLRFFFWVRTEMDLLDGGVKCVRKEGSSLPLSFSSR